MLVVPACLNHAPRRFRFREEPHQFIFSPTPAFFIASLFVTALQRQQPGFALEILSAEALQVLSDLLTHVRVFGHRLKLEADGPEIVPIAEILI